MTRYAVALAHREAESDIQTMSQRWLGLDWREFLPWTSNGLVVDLASCEETLRFVAAHYAELFDQQPHDDRWVKETMSPAKRRFLEESDRFAIRADDKTVGLVIGHPSDWSTYYIRSTAILLEYRGGIFVKKLLRRFEEILPRFGIRQIECDVAPNGKSCRIVQSVDYQVTGSLNTVRWGTMLRTTRFLDSHTDGTFYRQYCVGH